MFKRITIETLASGQPRPYADTILQVRVFFEWKKSYLKPPQEWEPFDIEEPPIREMLRSLNCGFTDSPPENWASPRLSYLKRTAPGTWEFQILTPFTD